MLTHFSGANIEHWTQNSMQYFSGANIATLDPETASASAWDMWARATATSPYVVLPAEATSQDYLLHLAKNFFDMFDNSQLTRTLPTSTALFPFYPIVFTYDIYFPPPFLCWVLELHNLLLIPLFTVFLFVFTSDLCIYIPPPPLPFVFINSCGSVLCW